MKALAGFIVSGRYQAILAASLCGILAFTLPPFSTLTNYLGAAVVSLVTLRIGISQGLLVLAAATAVTAGFFLLVLALLLPVIELEAAELARRAPEAVAVGRLAFVQRVKEELGDKGIHRAATPMDRTFTLREEGEAYRRVFAGKNDVLRLASGRFCEEKSELISLPIYQAVKPGIFGRITSSGCLTGCSALTLRMSLPRAT